MEGLGAAGGFVLGVCLIPQIVQTVRTKSTLDLSYGWQFAYFFGLSLIEMYAVWEGLWAIYAPAAVELASILVLCILKAHYDGCGREAWGFGKQKQAVTTTLTSAVDDDQAGDREKEEEDGDEETGSRSKVKPTARGHVQRSGRNRSGKDSSDDSGGSDGGGEFPHSSQKAADSTVHIGEVVVDDDDDDDDEDSDDRP